MKLKHKIFFKNFAQILLYQFRFILGLLQLADQRFVCCTFGFFKYQLVYDKSTKLFHKIYAPEVEDIRVLIQIFLNEQYKIENEWYAEIFEKFISINQKRFCVFDLGSNIGLASLYFAIKYPDWHVIGVEPSRRNYLISLINTRNNTNIKILEGAVDSIRGKVKISNSLVNYDAFQVTRDSMGEISTYTISDFMGIAKSLGVQPILCKMDIEGYEQEIFSNYKTWGEEIPCFMVEIHDWMMKDKITSHNYLKFIIETNRRAIIKGELIVSF